MNDALPDKPVHVTPKAEASSKNRELRTVLRLLLSIMSFLAGGPNYVCVFLRVSAVHYNFFVFLHVPGGSKLLAKPGSAVN
jgi:hypothetical protein